MFADLADRFADAATFDDALDALAEIDPGSLSDGAVHRGLLDLHQVESRLVAIKARYAKEWDRRQVWAQDGSKSPAARLAREVNCSRAAATRTMRLAATLDAHPHVAAALGDGTINTDHVELLRQAAARRRGPLFDEHETDLVGWCRDLDYPDAVTALGYWRNRADAAVGDSDGTPPEFDDRTATWGRGAGRERVLHGTFDPVGGAIVCRELDRLEQQMWQADRRAATRARSAAQRRADAIVEMARRSARATDDAPEPRILVTVAVGDASFRHLCELAGGDIIAPGHLRPYAGMIDVDTIVFDGPFRAITASPSRSFTGKLRRAIEIRDRHCQHPAGDHDPIDRCDVDHIVPRSDGGITCQCNGRLLSRHRNRNHRARRKTLADVVLDPDPDTELQRLAILARINALVCQRRSRSPDPDWWDPPGSLI